MALCLVAHFLGSMVLAMSVYLCQCEKKDLGYFPVLLTDNVRYRYFSVEKNQKVVSEGTKVKRVRVYDDMECVRRCTRVGDSCKSVNYKKKDTDGLCELLIKDTYDKPEPLQQKIHDQTYQHISLETPIHKTCLEVYHNNGRRNAVYNIAPIPFLSFHVYCDMTTAGGGWTVIQKRTDGSVDFYRDWAHYKKGFGNKLGEYWLGLDKMHAMTSQRGYRLRIDMEDFNGKKRYAEYETFIVADESDNYRLNIGGFSSGGSADVGDAMAHHNNVVFSTKDRDNDVYVGNGACADDFLGGWWYTNCYHANLNGKYYQSLADDPKNGTGIYWMKWNGPSLNPLKRVEMKIRPRV